MNIVFGTHATRRKNFISKREWQFDDSHSRHTNSDYRHYRHCRRSYHHQHHHHRRLSHSLTFCPIWISRQDNVALNAMCCNTKIFQFHTFLVQTSRTRQYVCAANKQQKQCLSELKMRLYSRVDCCRYEWISRELINMYFHLRSNRIAPDERCSSARDVRKSKTIVRFYWSITAPMWFIMDNSHNVTSVHRCAPAFPAKCQHPECISRFRHRFLLQTTAKRSLETWGIGIKSIMEIDSRSDQISEIQFQSDSLLPTSVCLSVCVCVLFTHSTCHHYPPLARTRVETTQTKQHEDTSIVFDHWAFSSAESAIKKNSYLRVYSFLLLLLRLDSFSFSIMGKW